MQDIGPYSRHARILPFLSGETFGKVRNRVELCDDYKDIPLLTDELQTPFCVTAFLPYDLMQTQTCPKHDSTHRVIISHMGRSIWGDDE